MHNVRRHTPANLRYVSIFNVYTQHNSNLHMNGPMKFVLQFRKRCSTHHVSWQIHDETKCFTVLRGSGYVQSTSSSVPIPSHLCTQRIIIALALCCFQLQSWLQCLTAPQWCFSFLLLILIVIIKHAKTALVFHQLDQKKNVVRTKLFLQMNHKHFQPCFIP